MDHCDSKIDLVKYLWVSDLYFILPYIIVIDLNYFYILRNGAGRRYCAPRSTCSGVNDIDLGPVRL